MLGDHKLLGGPWSPQVKMLNQIMMCSNKLIRILAQNTGKQVAVLEMDKK